ncbi:hypothetical protein ABIE78_003713 [Sinorhizobium fredii]|nr:autoinducer binding domain-containing protein [Sinorhizobium fredii]
MTFLVVCSGGRSALYPFYCTTYPDAWTEIYVDKHYFDTDPVIDVVRWGFMPVDWSSLDRRPAQVYRLFKEARSYDIGPHGLCPVEWCNSAVAKPLGSAPSTAL